MCWQCSRCCLVNEYGELKNKNSYYPSTEKYPENLKKKSMYIFSDRDTCYEENESRYKRMSKEGVLFFMDVHAKAWKLEKQGDISMNISDEMCARQGEQQCKERYFCKMCGMGKVMGRGESEERWCHRVLRSKVASLLLLKHQISRSPLYTLCIFRTLGNCCKVGL